MRDLQGRDSGGGADYFYGFFEKYQIVHQFEFYKIFVFGYGWGQLTG